jgi:cytochrome P450
MYLHEMISSRRQMNELGSVEQKHDLLNQLVNARDEEDTLSEDELIGEWVACLSCGPFSDSMSLRKCVLVPISWA